MLLTQIVASADQFAYGNMGCSRDVFHGALERHQKETNRIVADREDRIRGFSQPGRHPRKMYYNAKSRRFG